MITRKRLISLCFDQRNWWWKLLLFYAILMSPSPARAANLNYYVRAEVMSANGIIVNTDLIMVPARKEFRTAKFQTIIVGGNAPTGSQPDCLTAARHNAIVILLMQNGLKSIYSRQYTHNSKLQTVVVMRYEGVVRQPLEILDSRYQPDGSGCSANWSMRYSPIAFPDQWRLLYLRHKFNDYSDAVISLFQW